MDAKTEALYQTHSHIHLFLLAHNLPKTASALVKELNKNGTPLITEQLDPRPTAAGLLALLKAKVDLNRAKKQNGQKQNRVKDVLEDSSDEDSDDESSEEESSSTEQEEAAPIPAVKGKAKGEKAKEVTSESSSGSDSSDEVESSDEEEEETKAPEKKGVVAKVVEKVKEVVVGSAASAKKIAEATEESDSSSSAASSSDDSDSSSDEEEEEVKKSTTSSKSADKAGNKRKAAASSSSSSSSASDSSSDSSSDSDSSASSKAPTTKKRKLSESTPAAPHPAPTPIVESPVITTPNGSGKKGKKERVVNAPFRRVKAEDVTFADPRLKDNSFAARPAGGTDYGAKASADLIVTRGKGFTKEKNKKKRGSYRGGEITMASHSIKFNYD